ncbi:GMC family oxidoreductase, partial [Rhizobium ruizarguesonis]
TKKWLKRSVKNAARAWIGWPISYGELVPFYDEVEAYLGLYGKKDNVATLPDGIYAKPASLTPAEQIIKQAVENRWPERHVVSWRYIAPEADR